MTLNEIKEYNNKKREQLKQKQAMRDKQREKDFLKLIDKRWEKHVKRCLKKGIEIDATIVIGVLADRLPYYMEDRYYTYERDDGMFELYFDEAKLTWLGWKYYYKVQNVTLNSCF